jgi:hypothetical protein
MNYLSYPYPSTKYMPIFDLPLDLQNRRAILPSKLDAQITFTTIQDVARFVANAVDYKDVWPERGGISGTRTTLGELIKLVESIRGKISTPSIKTAMVFIKSFSP